MYNKSLIISVVFHLLFLAGLGLVSDGSDNLRTTQKRSPLIMVTLSMDNSYEAPAFLDDKTPVNVGQKKTDVHQEQSLLKEYREQTALSVAGETPPAELKDGEMIDSSIAVIEPDGCQVGASGSLNLGPSELVETGSIQPTDNQSPGAGLQDCLPVKIYAPSPGYPLKARESDWEGVTVLKVLIKTNGKIGEVIILESSGYQILDQAAVKAIKKWRYRPALKDGIAVSKQIRVRIKFELEE